MSVLNPKFKLLGRLRGYWLVRQENGERDYVLPRIPFGDISLLSKLRYVSLQILAFLLMRLRLPKLPRAIQRLRASWRIYSTDLSYAVECRRQQEWCKRVDRELQ